VAQALDVSSQRVASIMRAKNWHERFATGRVYAIDTATGLDTAIGNDRLQSRYAMIADE
jgi:hypothetical protein